MAHGLADERLQASGHRGNDHCPDPGRVSPCEHDKLRGTANEYSFVTGLSAAAVTRSALEDRRIGINCQQS
jgi:hypothetical protein